MYSENGLEVSRDAIEELLKKADVLAVGFSTFPERMLVDTRFTATAGTWSGIVEPVADVRERYLWLGRERGMFGAPQAFSFFVWPQTVGTLMARDVLGTLRERVALGGRAGVAAFDATLAALVRRERESWKEAIRGGDRYATMWAGRSARL